MCNSVKRRRWLNWAVVVKSFNCYIRNKELKETVGLKVKEREARDEREILVTLCWVRPFSIAILMKTSNPGCPFHGLRSCDVVVEP